MQAISRHYLGGERRERAAKRLPEQLCKPSMDARPLSSPVGYGPRQLSKHLWRHLTPSLHRSNLSLLSSHASAHIPQLSRLAANLPLLSPHQWDASKQKDRQREAASFSFPCSFPSFSSAVLPRHPRGPLCCTRTHRHIRLQTCSQSLLLTSPFPQRNAAATNCRIQQSNVDTTRWTAPASPALRKPNYGCSIGHLSSIS